MIGDRVDKFRFESCRESALEFFDTETVFVRRNGDHFCIETPEGHDCAEVGRAFHDYNVAWIEERLSGEFEGFDRAACDHQFARSWATALRGFQAGGHCIPSARQTCCGGVLHCTRVTSLHEFAHEVGRYGTRKGPRIREPAGKRNELRVPGEGKDFCESLTDFSASARRE